MIGDLEILRGTYTLLLRRFRIVNGRLNFNRVDVIDPEIDITAETNERDFIITVHLSGQASNPVIEFAARNSQGEVIAKNNDEILRLLAPGGALAGQLSDPGSNNSNINDLLGSVQLLFSEVQRDLARKLGVDEIRVDAPGPDDAFDVEEDRPKGPDSYGRVGVSKWITPDVSVSVSRGLSGTQANDLAVEYRLGRLLFLRGEIISRLYEVDRSSGDRRDEEYNVDLKFWYEY
jgi:autotransporter translocation and assembly factor TamB